MLIGKGKIINGRIVKDSKTEDGLNVDPEERIAIKHECDEIMASVGGDTKLFTNTVMKLSFGVPPADVVRWYLSGAKDSKTKDAEYPEVYKGFYIHLQSNDKLEGYRNDSKGNTKSFVKNTWNELKSVIDKYWADNPNGDSLDDEDVLTLDEKEMEEFFVKDAPPNYYGAIVAVAQSANNPLATREYVRKQIEPFMQAKGVTFVENEFNQAYSEFNKAGASKAAFFKGRDAAGDMIENYHGFEIKETNTGVDIFLNGSPVMNAKDVDEAHREIDKYRAERKANFQKGVKNMDSMSESQYLQEKVFYKNKLQDAVANKNGAEVERISRILAKLDNEWDNYSKTIKNMDSESVKSKQELLTEMVDHFKSKTYDEAIEIACYFPVVKVEEALMKGGFNKSVSQAGSRFLRGIITKDQFRAVESKSLMVRSYSVKTDKLTKDAIPTKNYRGVNITFEENPDGTVVAEANVKGYRVVERQQGVSEVMIDMEIAIDEILDTRDSIKTKDDKKEDYAEKLFNKLWDELSPKEKEKVQRHLEYDNTTFFVRKTGKDAAQSAGLTGGISPSEYNAEKKLLQDQLSKAVASGNTFKAKEVEKEIATLEQEYKTKDAVLEFNNVLVSVNKSSNGKYLAIARVNGQNQKVEGSTEQEAVSGIRQIIEEKTTQR